MFPNPCAVFQGALHPAVAAGYSRVSLSILDRVEQVIKELVPLTCEDFTRWGFHRESPFHFGPRRCSLSFDFLYLRRWGTTSWCVTSWYGQRPFFVYGILCNIAYLVVTSIMECHMYFCLLGSPEGFRIVADLQAMRRWWFRIPREIASPKKMYPFHRDRKDW